MNKDFLKFLLNLLILIFIIWIIFVIIIKNFGMYVFDEEYALYQQTLDYVNTKSDKQDSVIIFGDSVAKAAIIPENLDENAYNISMPGATPIEQYYILQDYLENHEAPNAIIMMYFMANYDSIGDFFWNRTVYFNCLKTNQFKEILATGYFSDSPTTSFFEFMQYKLCIPNKYYAALKNSILENRHEINVETYEKAEESKGQYYFGTADSYSPNNVSINNLEHFTVSNIIDYYINKCIELCKDYDIQVIIEQHPINLSTYVNLQKDFKSEYLEYLEGLQEKYPEIIVCLEYAIADDNWFGDFSHVNENGATKFTEMMKERYNEYFSSKEEKEN